MADEAPPIEKTPSGQWPVPRTDRGARKLIEHVDLLRDSVIELKASTVKYDRLIAILGAAATVIVSASWKVMNNNLERSDRIHAAEMKTLREEVGELRKVAPHIRGTYEVSVERKPREQVAAEVKRAIDRDGGT